MVDNEGITRKSRREKGLTLKPTPSGKVCCKSHSSFRKL